uniref:Homing endonuclease n=1 Tax=viral metagenome TaxID=1070528 RepID=A0A6C0CL61_9ZZZZ
MKRYAELGSEGTPKRGSISIAEKYPEYIKEWSEENTFKPEDVPIGSNQKIKWICACGNKWETRVYRRKNGCPVCFRKQKIQSQSVSRLYPDLVKEWHEDNTLNPGIVMYMSRVNVKWKCENNHTWISRVDHRTLRKSGCPHCLDMKIKWSIDRIRETSKINELTKCWIWPKDTWTYHARFNTKKWYIHQLSLFLSTGVRTSQEKPHVAHTCGNHQCVNPDHLRLATIIENCRDKDLHGTQLVGQKHPKSKLTDIQAQEIRESKERNRVLVLKYGVTRYTIHNIRSGKSRIQNMHAKYAIRERQLKLRLTNIASITPEDYKSSFSRAEVESAESDPVPNDSSIVLVTKCTLSKFKPNRDGYTDICVKNKKIRLHILSAMIHHNNCQPIAKDLVVRHLCRNRTCFNHEHLKIGSRRENAVDALRAGSNINKLSEEQVQNVYSQKGKINATSLAKQYSISGVAVSDIWKKRTWSHVTDKLD